MAATFDVYKEYEKLVPLFLASTELSPYSLNLLDLKYPIDLDISCKKLATTMKKIEKAVPDDGWDLHTFELMDILTFKIIRWMQWAKRRGNKEAEKWLDKNYYLVLRRLEELDTMSPEPPFNLLLWQKLVDALDRRSGLLFDLDYDMTCEDIASHAYMYVGWSFSFKYLKPSGLRVSFTVSTEDAQDNKFIVTKIKDFLVQQKKSKGINVIEDKYGSSAQTLELIFPELEFSKPDTYANTIDDVQFFVNNIEEAIQELDFVQLNQAQFAPYVDVQPAKQEHITEERDLGHEIINLVKWRYGAFLIQSGIKLRKAVMAADELILMDSDIKAEDLREDYEVEWTVPDNEMGEKLDKLLDDYEDFEEIENQLGQELQSRKVTISGELRTKFVGFISEDMLAQL